MKEKRASSNWNEEYRFFVDSPAAPPPDHLTRHFKKSVSREFNPSHSLVFAKLFAIHFISAALTLFFCPQLGFAVHGKSELLFDVFLRLGEYGCMLACGGLFLGATAFTAAFSLRLPEMRAIRNSRGLQWGLLALLSVGFFLSFREQESVLPLGLVLTWVVGALLGGVSVFHFGYWVRSRLR